MEFKSREEIIEYQNKKLRCCVDYASKNSRFFKDTLNKCNLKADDIKNIEDLHKLPFTTKNDLRDNYPFGLMAVPIDDIVRFHASSGTTGKSTVVYYTKNDLDTWADLMARVLATTGLTKKDSMQILYNYGFFTGGFGFHYGAERLGVSVIPTGAGNTKKQIEIMRDFGTTSFTSTPSYAIYLGETLQEMGIDPEKDLKLRIGVFGAEPWGEGMRNRIEELFNINAYDNYGLSELCGPGVAVECKEKEGLHVWEDYFIMEVIDPKTGESVGEGERGELVFTPLWKEAMPIFRYRTRDISRTYEDKCSCGLPFRKIERLHGRSDDMLIIRGVNVFPSQIEEVILKNSVFKGHYAIIVERKGPLDLLTVEIEVTKDLFTGNLKDLIELKDKVEDDLKSVLLVKANVKLVEEGTIPRSQGKAQRVLDKRNLGE